MNKDMKKKGIKSIIIITMILATLQVALGVSIEVNSSRYSITEGASDLEVMSTRYEPYPAQPGRYVDVWIKVENRGTNTIPNAEVKLEPEYPFTLYEGETALRNIGKLMPFQSAMIKYKVRIDSNAVLGANPLKFSFHENVYLAWKTAIIDITIQPRDLNLAIENITLKPTNIGPGEKGQIIFTIKNHGEAAAENVKIKLGLSDTTTPIAPINSVGEANIDLVPKGETREAVFDVLALSDATSKIYKIPVTMQYYDNLGKAYNQSNVFAIPVAKAPDLYFIMESTTIAGKKTQGDVIVKIVNPSASDVKFLDIEAMPSEAYELLSTKRAYVGKVDSDDYGTVEFQIYLKQANDDMSFNFPIKATYQDAANQQYTLIEDVDVSFAKSKYEKSGGSGISTFIIAVLIIGAGFFIYRRWKKKKESERKR